MDLEKEESNFDISTRSNRIIAEINKALSILEDHWPRVDEIEMNEAFNMVEYELKKKIRILEDK